MGRNKKFGFVGVVLSLALMAARPALAAPLTIGYSDWPGWVAWQVAIDKGWFKEAGVDVKFEWFDYVASMDAYSAGKIDAVTITNGDALVIGSGGAKGLMVIVNDYSNGNDMIVAKPSIKSMKDLKGQKIGVEIGFVDHLLVLKGLEDSGMKESDVELVNIKTNEAPQVLASGQVAAIAAWQPNSGLAMKALPGAHPIYTSAQAPGLIYDVLYATSTSVNANKDAYVKLAKVWGRVVAYIKDPATQDDAISIMAKRVGLTPAEYKPLLAGTRLLSLAEGKQVFAKADGLQSLYGSTAIVNDFNLKYEVYKETQNINSYIDASVTAAASP